MKALWGQEDIKKGIKIIIHPLQELEQIRFQILAQDNSYSFTKNFKHLVKIWCPTFHQKSQDYPNQGTLKINQKIRKM